MFLCYNIIMETLKKRSLFWDVKNIDMVENAKFVIERVLSFGDENDFRWMLENYGKEKVEKVFRLLKNIDRKSLYFWCNYFDIDPTECTQKQSKMKLGAFWKR